MAELQREREGEGEEAKRVTTARVVKRGEEVKWKNLRFPARGGETVRGTREFTTVGVTLDKRRGLYVVLTPRLSTEKQPLSPTYWKPPWTSVTTIVAKRT